MRLHDGDDETTRRGGDVPLAGLSGEGGWEESWSQKERERERGRGRREVVETRRRCAARIHFTANSERTSGRGMQRKMETG